MLPDGVLAELSPPAETRIAIGGKFLDEVKIRMNATSSLSFPVEGHRGEIGSDGVVTIRTKMPTVVALFAEGALRSVHDAPVEITVGGKNLGLMVVSEVRCAGHVEHDVAVLVFRSLTVAGRSC